MGIIRNTLNWYARLSPGRKSIQPPYYHVTQIGDPVLRRVSEPVKPEDLQSPLTKSLIDQLQYVMEKYGSVGMSAPQIGISKRIFVFQLTEKQLKKFDDDFIRRRQIHAIPFTAFINPEVKVLDYQKVVYDEGCESVRGFQADVSRYKSVQVTGFNQDGEKTEIKYSGWPARIVQHEMDHLDGKLYTDIMDKTSLSCRCWEEINYCRGRVTLPYTP